MDNRKKILIADDSEMNRAILADMLGDEYETLEAADGSEAVAILKQQGSSISLVLLDIVMPHMDGYEVLAVMNKQHWIDDIPVIMISAENRPSYIERAYELGVSDFISRPFDALVVRRRVINTIMLYAKQKKLIGMVADQIYEREKSSSLMVNILSHIVEFRNGESGLHVLHIHTITELLLKRLVQLSGCYRLSARDISLISTASALHDIGKIGIDDKILNKPGPLTDAEFEIMRTHTVLGANMLEEMPYHQNEPLVKTAYAICRWHHERYDGSGYPDGLKGEEIPISAQVVALADVYDALISKRVYKEAYTHEQAVQMILKGECGAFNPLLLNCLKDIAETLDVEIRINSLSRESYREIRSITEEMLRHEETAASARTLRLLEQERSKYQFFAAMSQEIQFEYTTNPPMLVTSEWGAAQLGIDEIIIDPLRNLSIKRILGGKNLKTLIQMLRQTTPEQAVVQFECILHLHKQARWHRIVARATWSDEEPPQYIGAIGKVTDIHEEHLHMQNLQHMASHDALTGLLNHAAAREIIARRMKENPEGQYALIIVDLDFFKAANDQFGHIFGDRVLQYTAQKLLGSIRAGDIGARVGGDEFLIFVEYTSGIENMVERIWHALLGQFEGFAVSVSMGIACKEQGAGAFCDYDTLLYHADRALYAAKREGRGQYRFYDDSMQNMLSVISPIDNETQGKHIQAAPAAKDEAHEE